MAEVAVPPRSVLLAVRLLWAAVAVDAVQYAVSYFFPVTDLSQVMPPGLDLAGGALPAVLTEVYTASLLGMAALDLGTLAFLVVKVAGGKRWARGTYLLTFVLTFLLWLPSVGDLARGGDLFLAAALTLAQLALQGWALGILYSSGREWFDQEHSHRRK